MFLNVNFLPEKNEPKKLVLWYFVTLTLVLCCFGTLLLWTLVLWYLWTKRTSTNRFFQSWQLPSGDLHTPSGEHDQGAKEEEEEREREGRKSCSRDHEKEQIYFSLLSFSLFLLFYFCFPRVIINNEWGRSEMTGKGKKERERNRNEEKKERNLFPSHFFSYPNHN